MALSMLARREDGERGMEVVEALVLALLVSVWRRVRLSLDLDLEADEFRLRFVVERVIVVGRCGVGEEAYWRERSAAL